MPLSRLARTFLERPMLFIVAGGATAVAVACFVGVMLYQMRVDAFARARDMADNLALVLERDIERNIEIYELSMQAVIDGAKDPAILTLPPKIRQLVLFDRSSNAKDLGALLVTDTTGKVTIDSRAVPPREINLAEQEYFQAQRDSLGGAGLFISKPLVPHFAKQGLSIALSERLEDARGQFTGIVVGTLRLNYFRHLFDGPTLGANDSITLFRTDGTVLMRRPYNEAEIGRNIANAPSFAPLIQAGQGRYLGTAALDGTKRLYSFRHIGRYPLIVVVGLATEDVYAEWEQRAWAIGGTMILLNVLLVMMSVALAQQFRVRLEMEQQLQMLADTDSLTGLGTRRALDAAIEVEWRRARRNKHSVSVLMVDADYFKAFNDYYGHVMGDQALKVVSSRIVENIRRPGDFAGRYGGEEFCVLLPDTSLAGALQIAEAIRLSVLAASQLHVGSPIGQLSVSIGVAAYSEEVTPGMTSQQLLHEADERLYEAKAAGRNTVRPARVRSNMPSTQR